MTDNTKENDQITPLQAKVFNRWISFELNRATESKYTDITKDFSNGNTLIELANALTHNKISHHFDNNLDSHSQSVQNCEQAFKILKNDGFVVPDITVKDITNNNQKLINEFIWELISHYSIEKSFEIYSESTENVTKANAKSILLAWAVQRTQSYKKVFDFKPYDLALCALLDSYHPNKINYYVLDLDDHQQNFKLAIDVMNELGIPCLIYPEDISQNGDQIDKKALLTQLSLARMVLEDHLTLKHQNHHHAKNNKENIEEKENPEVLTVSDADKRFETGPDAKLHAQIRGQRRKRCVSRLQEHKSEAQIKREEENHERRIKEKEIKEEKEKKRKSKSEI